MDIELKDACQCGFENIARILIDSGANNLDACLGEACGFGHKNIVLLLIEKGAINYKYGLNRACIGGHDNLALLMIEKGNIDYNYGLTTAAFYNRKSLALLMIGKGANINLCFIELSEYDIQYLVNTNNVKNFGYYWTVANYCKNRGNITKEIMENLNMRDVDSIILSY